MKITANLTSISVHIASQKGSGYIFIIVLVLGSSSHKSLVNTILWKRVQKLLKPTVKAAVKITISIIAMAMATL